MAKKKKNKAIQFQIGWPGLIALVVSTFCAFLWIFVLGFWMGQKVATGNNPNASVEVYEPGRGVVRKVPDRQPVSADVVKGVAPSSVSQQDSLARRKLASIKKDLKQEQETLYGGEQGGEGAIKTERLDSSVEEGRHAVKQESVTHSAHNESVHGKSSGTEKDVKHQVNAERPKKSGKNVHRNAGKAAAAPKTTHRKAQKGLPKRYFALQIASYRRMEQAKRESAVWEKKGYFTKIKKADLGRKGIWFRVYIGRYASLEEAKKASVRLASKEGIRSYVASFGR